MPLSYSLDNIQQMIKDEIGFNIDKLLFIRLLNRLLIDLNITKPAEQLGKIYYVKDFRKYPVESDFRYPIGLRNPSGSYVSPLKRKSPAVISQNNSGEMYSVQNNAGITFLEILHYHGDNAISLLTDCESLTDDGVWTAGSGASNVQLNTDTKHKGSSSVSFDISGATAEISFLKTSGLDASAFTEHQGFGAYIWPKTKPTQIVVKWGTDSSNYYQQTLTAQASGEAFDITDKNEIRTDRNDATETGSVDDSDIKYFSFTYTFTTSTTDTDFLIDNPTIFKPDILPFEYYSKYLATNSAGVLIAKITESQASTDKPLVFDDYIPAIIDGLAWLYFRKKDRELSEEYKNDYVSKQSPSGALTGGKRWLESKYPNRNAHIRRGIRLPTL